MSDGTKTVIRKGSFTDPLKFAVSRSVVLQEVAQILPPVWSCSRVFAEFAHQMVVGPKWVDIYSIEIHKVGYRRKPLLSVTASKSRVQNKIRWCDSVYQGHGIRVDLALESSDGRSNSFAKFRSSAIST